MTKRARLLTLVLALLLALPAFAADFSKGLLDRAAVIEAAREVTGEKYPNSDDVLVDDHIRSEYKADGTSLTVDDTFVKVLTEKGKRENQTLSFHFNLNYSTVRLDRLEVIKPDGRAVPVDVEKQSRVMVDRSQMGSNIYDPNDKILRVGVPDLEIGDMVRYVSVRNIVKARVPNTWSDYQVFEYTSPIKRMLYEVVGPKELPLRSIALKAEVPGTVTHTKKEEFVLARVYLKNRDTGERTDEVQQMKTDRLIWRWEVRDVPRMYEEPSMPPLYTCVQRLLVSTIPDWKTISKWYWNLSEPHFKATPAIEKKVAELTRGIDDRQKKIEAIFKFVSQDIRYMGITIEKEAPGYEPHDVSLTFENRYGVCRDKAALLVAMLRSAGFEAFPVIIHNGPKKDEEVPQPYFNHAVSAVLEPDGSYQLMDSTDENTKELLPAYLCNKSYLVARPEGETLLTSPIVPAGENLVRIETKAALDAAGGLKADTTLRFEGINDNAYRGYFARIKPEQRRQFFEAVAKRVVPGANMVEFRLTPEDMQDTSKPLTAFLKIVAKDVLIEGGKTVMVPSLLWGARVGMVNFILGRTGLKERKYPLVTDFACGVRETLTLDLGEAAGEALSLPESAPIVEPTLEWRRGFKLADGSLEAKGEFLLKVPEFTPKQYRELKETLKTIEYNARKAPIFARPAAQGEADVELLDSEVVYDVGDDPSEWAEIRTVKKRVLTYAGTKDNSELKINYNPAWEEVKIEKATVTTAEGEVREITEKEINILDAAWVGAAPRYPAGKTLVASLPGVGVGSVIEYRIRQTKKARPFFFASEYFRGYDPIRRKRVEIRASSAAQVGWSVKADAPASEDAAASGDAGAAGSAAWEAVDQPAVKRERSLPPWWAFNPHVFVSTGKWDAYANDVRAVLDQAASGGAAAAKAKEVTAGAEGAEAVVRIRDFVAKNIRAAGPDLDEVPLSAVTPADRTLAEGYGNTADRAVLLAAMLKAAGLAPRFVLASWREEAKGLRDPRLDCPDPSLFPQVLVAVDAGGKTVYLNDTDQYAALGATPHDGCYALDVESGKPFVIRAIEDKRNRTETEYTVKLDDEGAAEVERVQTYYGGDYAGFHRRAAEMPAEERRRYQLELAGSISQSAEIIEPLASKYDAYPGRESLRVKVERFAAADGPFMYFVLPDSFRDLFRVLADTRANPLYWAEPTRTTLRVRVSLPEAYRSVELAPPRVSWTAPGGAGHITVETARIGAGELTVTYRAELEAAVIDPAEYDRVLEIGRRLGHAESRTVMLRKTEPNP